MSGRRRGRWLRQLLVVLLVAVVVLGAVAVQRLVADPSASVEQATLGVPAAPAAAPEVGMYVASRVLGGGRIEVQHWIRGARAVRSLAIRAADPDDKLGTVVARGLVALDEDGRLLAQREEVTTGQQELRLRRPVRAVYLTYVVTGGIDDGSDAPGAVPGRVLARVTSLDVDYAAASGPVVRLVESRGGGTVLGLGCLPRTPGVNPSACGRPAAAGAWQVDLSGADRDDRVLASLETG